MSMTYILLPLSLVLAACAVGVFVWAVRSGQFDDLESPPQRMLTPDDDDPDTPEPVDPDDSSGGTPSTTRESRG